MYAQTEPSRYGERRLEVFAAQFFVREKARQQRLGLG